MSQPERRLSAPQWLSPSGAVPATQPAVLLCPGGPLWPGVARRTPSPVPQAAWALLEVTPGKAKHRFEAEAASALGVLCKGAPSHRCKKRIGTKGLVRAATTHSSRPGEEENSFRRGQLRDAGAPSYPQLGMGRTGTGIPLAELWPPPLSQHPCLSAQRGQALPCPDPASCRRHPNAVGAVEMSKPPPRGQWNPARHHSQGSNSRRRAEDRLQPRQLDLSAGEPPSS